MLMSLLAILISYLIGSIPFGYLAGRMVCRIDIRLHGSGNIGATNVTRIMGFKWGVAVFIADLIKGAFGPLLVGILATDSLPLIYLLAGIAAVAGHNWPLFLGFKGGKGVSTSLGAVIGICFIFTPLFMSLGCALAVWLAVFFL